MTEILFARLDELLAAQSSLQLQIDAIAPIDNPNINALALLDGTAGFLVQTGVATFTKRSLVAPAAGVSITNPAGTAGDATFALTNDLLALEGLASTGFAVRTAADTWAQRSLAGTANEITVTNGDGVAGNLSLSLPASLTFTGKTITGGTFNSPTLVTPALGTPSAGVATNLTGTAAGLTAGHVTTNANLTGPITSSGNATAVASQTGTGTTFVMDTSPTLVTPTLGVALATSINKVVLTPPAAAATLTILNNKTLTANNSLTLAGTDGTTLTFQATDTYVGRATTDTLTNKTLASTTNSIGINAMALGSDATGDIYYRNSSGNLTRLGIGSATNVLTVSGGLPAWAAAGAGSGNVSNVGTPLSGQIAQWTSATTIQGQTLVPTSNLASSGTANSGTFLRGDQVWAAVPATITSMGAVATTSGTAINFTGIPAGVKRITVVFNGVSTSGADSKRIRLGTSGGVVSTGYLAVSLNGTTATAVGQINNTDGFLMNTTAAGDLMHGMMTIMNVSGNIWEASFVIRTSTTFAVWGGGGVTLGGTLDRVQLATAGGTDTFDAGSMNVYYE